VDHLPLAADLAEHLGEADPHIHWPGHIADLHRRDLIAGPECHVAAAAFLQHLEAALADGLKSPGVPEIARRHGLGASDGIAARAVEACIALMRHESINEAAVAGHIGACRFLTLVEKLLEVVGHGVPPCRRNAGS